MIHRLLVRKFGNHLVKCARNHSDFAACPYNDWHRHHRDRLDRHLALCLQAQLAMYVQQLRNGDRTTFKLSSNWARSGGCENGSTRNWKKLEEKLGHGDVTRHNGHAVGPLNGRGGARSKVGQQSAIAITGAQPQTRDNSVSNVSDAAVAATANKNCDVCCCKDSDGTRTVMAQKVMLRLAFYQNGRQKQSGRTWASFVSGSRLPFANVP